MRKDNEVTALLDDAHEVGNFFSVVKKQIDIGMTLARTAELEHARCNRAFGSRAARAAVRIYRGLRDHLDNPYLGNHRRWVEQKLRELASMIDGLKRKYSDEIATIA